MAHSSFGAVKACEGHRSLAVYALLLAALLLAVASGISVVAQERGSADKPETPAARDSTDMREMASAMKSMADMCRTMMEREMQSRPYLVAAGAGVGALLVIALILFIVLEVQWIRLLGVRIKAERNKRP